MQAVYGENISNYVGITGKPSTSRFPVTDLAAEAGDAYVTLTWSKPSTTVLSYTLSYYNEDATGDVTEQPLDKDATAITLDNLVNDKNYYFSLVANYAKGTSEAATVKAMPTQAIPYSLDRDKAAKNQPITFTFNTADYPTATDVKWTFPGDVVKQGTVVKYGLGSVGTQTVKLSATINGNVRTWNLEVEIREYVVYSTDWAQDGSNYNGFKGSCPVFSPDGKTVYIITFNKVAGLYAFDLATGSEKWRYIPAAKSNSYNMLTVNPVTGDIYYGTTGAGQFYAVTAEGQLKWTFTEAGSMQSCSPGRQRLRAPSFTSATPRATRSASTLRRDRKSGPMPPAPRAAACWSSRTNCSSARPPTPSSSTPKPARRSPKSHWAARWSTIRVLPSATTRRWPTSALNPATSEPST